MYMLKGGYSCSDTDQELLRFEAMKLSANLPQGESARYAALTTRVLLEFDSSRQPARAKEAKLVESHMRTVLTISEHREFMRTGAPSEPMLAEAAGMTLDPEKIGTIQYLGPQILSHAFSQGHVAKGERRKMVTCLLWTIAHNRALHGMPVHAEDNNVHFHRPIKVIEFLKVLYAEEWHEFILNVLPIGDEEGKPLKDAFANAYIHFSHFACAADSDVITAPYLLKALFRGMTFNAEMTKKISITSWLYSSVIRQKTP